MYQAAIVGCGQIAGGYENQSTALGLTHGSAYQLCPDTKLVAVADPNEEQRKNFMQKWSIPRGYGDLQQMLDAEKIDILSICSPTPYHYAHFKSAIDQAIPMILLEKPLSEDLLEAKEMLQMSQNSLVALNFFRRWNPQLQKLQQQLQRQEWGLVLKASFRYTKGLKGNCSHLIDLACWFFGAPEEIIPLRVVDKRDGDPGVDFCLMFAGGILVYFLHIPRAEYVFIDGDILAANGRVNINQRGQEIIYSEQTTDPNYGFAILKPAPPVQTQWTHACARAVAELVQVHRHGGQVTCTMSDGYRTAEICHQIIKKLS